MLKSRWPWGEYSRQRELQVQQPVGFGETWKEASAGLSSEERGEWNQKWGQRNRHLTQREKSRSSAWRKHHLGRISSDIHVGRVCFHQRELYNRRSSGGCPASLQFPSVPFVMEPAGRPLDTCPATSGRGSTEGLEREVPSSGGLQKTRKRLLWAPGRVSNEELDFFSDAPLLCGADYRWPALTYNFPLKGSLIYFIFTTIYN